jgi:hypothetical protein
MLSEAIRERIRREFPPDQWERVTTAIEYAPHTGDRIPNAILNVAGGDLRELRAAANRARTDYRELLLDGEADTNEGARKAMREARRALPWWQRPLAWVREWARAIWLACFIALRMRQTRDRGRQAKASARGDD